MKGAHTDLRAGGYEHPGRGAGSSSVSRANAACAAARAASLCTPWVQAMFSPVNRLGDTERARGLAVLNSAECADAAPGAGVREATGDRDLPVLDLHDVPSAGRQRPGRDSILVARVAIVERGGASAVHRDDSPCHEGRPVRDEEDSDLGNFRRLGLTP